MPSVFATTLRRCLEQREMTVVELAKRSGIARNSLHRLLNGWAEPHYSTIRKVAKGLGVQPFDLFELTPVEEVPLNDTLYRVVRIASQLSPKSQQRILRFTEFERDL